MHTRNALWINNWRYVPPASEFIEIKMMADENGKVYVPTAGCNGLRYTGSHYGNNYYDAPYNWDVLVDNTRTANITGTSSRQGYREVGSGYTPGSFHIIKIYPHVYHEETGLPDYGWCMAFAMGGNCSGSNNLTYKNPIADYLYEILYDGAILGYRNSDHILGSGYKTCQYAGCINLTRTYEETDISDITEIGCHFLCAQYAHSGVTASATEKTPDCLNGQTAFREQQYWKCESLLIASDEIDPPRITTGSSYREGQYGWCSSLIVTAPENPPSTLNGGDEYKYNQYLRCTSLRTISRIEYCAGAGLARFREGQFSYCGDIENPITARITGNQVVTGASNSLGLSNDKVNKIYVPSNLVTAYQNSSNWSDIDDNKFVGF